MRLARWWRRFWASLPSCSHLRSVWLRQGSTPSQTVLEEANAIGTTYLRTRLLPEPQKSRLAKMLRDYVDVRAFAVQEGNIGEAIAESEKLQESMWQQAVAAADKDRGSIMTGLFVQSLNEMIDVHAKRSSPACAAAFH